MLKKIRAAGEAVGVLSPSVADASKSADEHRQALIAAQAALEKAQDDLHAAHDRGAENPEVIRFEAAVAAAKADVARAEGRYRGAEKRLAAARDAAAEKSKAAMITARDAALGVRGRAAEEIDRLAVALAAQVRLYDEQAGKLSEAAAVGVASRTLPIGGQDLARHALERAGALPSRWVGNKAEQPGAVEMAARDADAVRAGMDNRAEPSPLRADA